MKELEAEVYCTKCKAFYGKVFRVQYGEGLWKHESEPTFIPKYCHVCEQPTERCYAH